MSEANPNWMICEGKTHSVYIIHAQSITVSARDSYFSTWAVAKGKLLLSRGVLVSDCNRFLECGPITAKTQYREVTSWRWTDDGRWRSIHKLTWRGWAEGQMARYLKHEEENRWVTVQSHWFKSAHVSTHLSCESLVTVQSVWKPPLLLSIPV